MSNFFTHWHKNKQKPYISHNATKIKKVGLLTKFLVKKIKLTW